MTNRWDPINDRQADLLERIADGDTLSAPADASMRTTAYALRSRGLVAISGLPDGTLARHLDRAIGGCGAFRCFKDVLADHPTELESYCRFTHTRKTDRAAAWLAEVGYRAVMTQSGS